jgi:hypothetical protein
MLMNHTALYICFVLLYCRIEVLARRAAEIRQHERLVLKEVLDNDRCLLEFMTLFDSHNASRSD